MAHFDTGKPHWAHFDTEEPHCPPDVRGRCNLTKCSCGAVWSKRHRQIIGDEEPTMNTYLISWVPSNVRERHMFQTIEAENAEEAVRKFENVYGVTADAIAYPVQKNAWSYLRHVEPPSDNRVNSDRIVF